MQLKHLLFSLACVAMPAVATNHVITSPQGTVAVTLNDDGGHLTYSVTSNGKTFLTTSRLGLKTNIGDFTTGLTLKEEPKTAPVSRSYDMTRTKFAHIDYSATRLEATYLNKDGLPMTVTFEVSDKSVAYRYTLGRGKNDDHKVAVIYGEASSFNFPEQTTTFLCPQSKAMVGWERTKPSYEEEYKADAPMTDRSAFGTGYTFPCLFRIGADGWVLVSETGVTGRYVGSRLSDYDPQTGYTVTYPMEGEANGWGSNSASIGLPGSTPWRIIALGSTLKPIVESTVQYDVVDQLYEPSQQYKPGRYTWSWLIWQDAATNYDDQVKFIDLASQMGYEYCLVDALWDTQIGHKRIEDLAAYAKTKNVRLLLWYNSNGNENDAPQGPRGVMDNIVTRKAEMRWMQKIGVAGIKVDFFGGDKQHTMALYEDILSDANDYGIQVIFHGCTMPRGWERMYPNYVGSEAALASENVFFTDYHAKKEGFEMTMHPFSRNAVGSFDWGGVIMNRHLSKDNKSRHPRYTSDIFELATAITNQASVNCVMVTPQAMDSIPPFEMDFLRQIPTTWQDTRFIDGYPTRYAVIARQHDGQWYVGGINGTNKAMTLTLDLPMFAGKTVTLLTDRKAKKGQLVPTAEQRTLRVSKDGKTKVTMQPMGGIVITE